MQLKKKKKFASLSFVRETKKGTESKGRKTVVERGSDFELRGRQIGIGEASSTTCGVCALYDDGADVSLSALF